jgi:ferredoxin
MNISRVNLVYFSPTNTSRYISSAVSKGIGLPVKHINLTLSDIDHIQKIPCEELIIFASPVYSGRIPEIALKRFKKIQGYNTPAVLLVVYGNRAYEDALLELKQISHEQGCIPVAAGAFIGEHSYHNKQLPIAEDRPDKEDIKKAIDFGKKIHKNISSKTTVNGELLVPGNKPYRRKTKFKGRVSPETHHNVCILCGLCADICPTTSIKLEKEVTTNKTTCIRCCACIKVCPTGARVSSERILELAKWLYDNYSERKEPEIFI